MPLVEQNFADLTVMAKVTIVAIIVFFTLWLLPQLLVIVGVVGHTLNKMSQAARKKDVLKGGR